MSDFDLAAFRTKYPVKPWDMVRYMGKAYEAISYPWPTDSGASINLRVKDQPQTMFEADMAHVEIEERE